MRAEVGAFSRRGADHDRNEDCFLVAGHVARDGPLVWKGGSEEPWIRRYGLLVAVADGIGSYAGAERASWLVIERLAELYHGEALGTQAPEAAAARLENILTVVNEDLVEQCSSRPEIASAGTTLAGAAIFASGQMIVFHAGDSRVYRASAGLVRQLTRDHVAGARSNGPGDAAGAGGERSAQAGALTNALGPYGLFRPEISLKHCIAAGERLLLATDGVVGGANGIDLDALRAQLSRSAPAELTAPALVEAARAQGGRDDATAIVVDLLADCSESAPAAGKVGPRCLGSS